MAEIKCPRGARVKVKRTANGGWSPQLGSSYQRSCLELREYLAKSQPVADFQCNILIKMAAAQMGAIAGRNRSVPPQHLGPIARALEYLNKT
jgi:hypothetical protein